VSGRAVVQPSVWGEEFEENMAKLLRWAVQRGSAKGSYTEAIRRLAPGEHYLNRIIRNAGLEILGESWPE